MRMRKAVASGLTALLATAALAGCGDAPESSASGGDGGGEETPAALDFLPCIVSDAGGFDDKSFNQLGYEGVEQAADELGVEFKRRRVQQRERLRAEHREPGRRGLRRHRDRRLRARRPRPRSRRPPTPTSSTSSSTTPPTVATTARLRRQGRRSRTSSRSSSTPPRRRSSPATRRRTTPRPVSSAPTAACRSRPSRSSWTASSRAPSTTPRRRARTSRSSAGTARTACSPVASRPTRRPPTPLASSSTRTSTCILPVGGPIYQGALTAIDDSGADIAMLGVDADVFETDPNTQDVILTSILKNMKVSTYEAIMSAGSDGDFDFDAVRRHARERRRRPRAVPQLREQGVRQPRRGAGRGEGRHHRRLDPGRRRTCGFVISS